MPEDDREFQRAIKDLLDRYPKDRVLAALERMPVRPGPKRKDDSATLIRMGRIMTWHRNLSDRAAAEIVTRHLPNDRSSVIDRIRKGFAKDRQYYLRTGKVNEIINLTMAEVRATRAGDKDGESGKDDEGLVTLKLPDDETLETVFQNLRSRLQAICAFDAATNQPVVICLKLKSREIREVIVAQLPSSLWEEFGRE